MLLVDCVGNGDDGDDGDDDNDAPDCFLWCLGEAGGLCLSDDGGDVDADNGAGGTIAACSAAAVTLTPLLLELPLLLPAEDGGEPLLFLRGDFDLAMTDRSTG